MFDDNAHEQRRAARVLLEKERAATFLATLVPMFEAARSRKTAATTRFRFTPSS